MTTVDLPDTIPSAIVLRNPSRLRRMRSSILAILRFFFSHLAVPSSSLESWRLRCASSASAFLKKSGASILFPLESVIRSTRPRS